MTQSSFSKFPSIEGFAHAAHNQTRSFSINDTSEPVLYGLKPKLHGTNAAVRIDSNGRIQAQSRKRDITPEDDNYGFAAWIEDKREFFESLATFENIIIFGEWAGAGVQDTDAVNKLDHKAFFPFAVQSDDVLHTDTDILNDVFGNTHLAMPDDIHIVPHLAYVTINFSDPESVQYAVNMVNDLVEQFEKVDPYIANKFGIKEPGEGVVGAPIFYSGLHREEFGKFAFKAKTQHHRGRKAKAAASGRFQVTSDVMEMALSYVTEARLRQALKEGVGGELDIKRTGDFLKWIGGDVKKESATELKAAGIEWKQIASIVATASADWFKAEVAKTQKLAA